MVSRFVDQAISSLVRLARLGVFLFLMLPLVFVAVMSINSHPGSFPPNAISLVWYEAFLSRSDFKDGLFVSVLLALSVTAIALIVGTLCAFPLARVRFRGRNLLASIFLSPLAVPQIASAVALLNFFILVGVISRRFEVLLIAHTIIALPYVIRVVTGSLIGFDRSLEEASLNLGANMSETVLRITIPLIKPGLLAGAFFAFQASWSNVTVSAFLYSTNVTPLPVVLFSWMRFAFDPSLAAIATLLMAFTISVVFLLERILGLDKLIGVAGGLQSI
jgi:putative spermidine/putrescine transport system permease protein